ncbi:MAG: AraC family transcriptional regulator [Myxococcota bacterium]|nr:AraC family transcriptional regulator [Myxococcota bacterium]
MYREIRPDPRLAPFVECLSVSDDGGAPAPAPIRVVPDGCVDLIVSVGPEGAARAEVWGVKTRALLVRDREPTWKLGVRLRAGVARRFLALPADELRDRSADLGAAWSRDGRRIAEHIADAAPEARARLLESTLLERLLAGGPPPNVAVEQAARRIDAARGAIAVGPLCDSLGVGERWLERHFLRHVGVAPKRYARIVRFRHAWQALRGGRAQAEVALELGYCDQSHLLRDFRAFAGTSPGAAGVSDSSNPAAAA